jgi:hypothetical protein
MNGNAHWDLAKEFAETAVIAIGSGSDGGGGCTQQFSLR